MNIQLLTEFFKWCSIINFVLFLFSVAMFFLAPDFVFAVQSSFFTISRDAFNETIYEFLGLYKTLLIFFNLVPYIALRIVGGKA